MVKSQYVDQLNADVEGVGDVCSLSMQDLLWPGITEIRCYTKDKKVYSALYEGEHQVTEFACVPNQEVK